MLEAMFYSIVSEDSTTFLAFFKFMYPHERIMQPVHWSQPEIFQVDLQF